MKVALIENGAIAKIGDHRECFPSTSFTAEGPDAEFLAQNSALPVVDYLSFNAATEKLVDCTPFVLEGKVYTVEVVPASNEEALAAANKEAARIRLQRNGMLSACDWTQLSDAPVNSGEWATYRQALRDISAQQGFPWSVVWPSKPE